MSDRSCVIASTSVRRTIGDWPPSILPDRFHVMRYSCLLLFGVLLLGVSLASASPAAETIQYTKDVAPILRKYCGGCHNEDDAEAGFNLDSHAALLAGGDNGSVITPGSADSSRLLQMIRGTIDPQMPPEDEKQLTEDEFEVIETWIEQGAAGPDGDLPMTLTLSTPQIESSPDTDRPATAVAVSADGSVRALGRFGSIEITHTESGEKPPVMISDLPGKVNSLTFSQDGQRLLAASGLTGAYGRAAIYRVKTGELLHEMIGHRDTIYAAAFSPDESIVATAGYDRTIVLWDVATGNPINELVGHNGAIFDLAFSPDGKVLASACADETVKLWHVDTGRRLDTLSQPEGEVFAVDFSHDGRFIVATSGDNRLRVWRFVSKAKPRINPLVATRFIDESPLVNFSFSPRGDSVVVMAASGNMKVIRTDDWSQANALAPLPNDGSDLCVTPDGKKILIALMNGEMESRQLPPLPAQRGSSNDDRLRRVYMAFDELKQAKESDLRREHPSAAPSNSSNETTSPTHSLASNAIRVGRGIKISGQISKPREEDFYQWKAEQGEVWAIDADPDAQSSIDPTVTILDESGEPVLRVRLQAIRDSYFTFRGKDSMQVNDFRVFNWQEMKLGQFLYAAGEVTRLWMHPRGPDSGFNVYPGQSNRWTYFGTTHSAHALGEPAYIVRPLGPEETPVANGLPVFDVFYENDDDPKRVAGTSSRLLFTAPRDGLFTVRISDTRGDGGDDFRYNLSIRAAEPDFVPSIGKVNSTLRRGTGRELVVEVQRQDGFEGPVTFACENLPPEIQSTFPVSVEQGQKFARASFWIDENVDSITDIGEMEVTATAKINGRLVRHRAGKLKSFTVGPVPSVIPSIHPIDQPSSTDESWTLQVRRGETVSAKLLLKRKDGFEDLVAFGKEDAARSATQGVYVDNIGLNGLLLPAKVSEREFFLTADPTAVPGTRPFYLRANVDGNVTSRAIMVEVLP